jgi:hypothetical protein
MQVSSEVKLTAFIVKCTQVGTGRSQGKSLSIEVLPYCHQTPVFSPTGSTGVAKGPSIPQEGTKYSGELSVSRKAALQGSRQDVGA